MMHLKSSMKRAHVNSQQSKDKFSIGDLVWIPQNTEVQKSYAWVNGYGYYPGDITDLPMHGVVIDKFNDALDTEYVGLAVSWKEKKIVCRMDDVFSLMENK